MCGILCVVGNCCCDSLLIKDVSKISETIKHRGPDETGIVWLNNKYILCHERLSIVGTRNGNQPFEWNGNNQQIHLSVNGEIYNYKQLYLDYLSETNYQSMTLSDCEVILHLYRKYGVKFLSLLQGMYSFILFDTNKHKNKTKIFCARDVIGIKPLFIGYDYSNKKCIYLASEMKAISKRCDFVQHIEPGHYCYDTITNNNNNNKFTFKPFYFPLYHNKEYNYYNNDDLKTIKQKIKSLLIESVKIRMLRDTNNDIKIGTFLSGGLDSSLVTAIACKFTNELYTFSVGLKYYDNKTNEWIIGKDIIAARKVVKYLSKTCNIIHNEYLYHPNDVLKNNGKSIKDTISALESYDEINVRPSISNLFAAKVAYDNNIKLILCGEGADEIFGGYLHLKYFTKNNLNDFQKRMVEMLNKLKTTHLRRQDGCSMNYGVETRVPFLDEKFMNYVMTINPKYKLHSFNNIEKYILRSAFDDGNKSIIPKEILYRQKCTFSEGVGMKLYKVLIDFCDEKVTDLEMKNVKETYPINTPKSKTQYYYRYLFETQFGRNVNNCVELLSTNDPFKQRYYDEMEKNIVSKL